MVMRMCQKGHKVKEFSPLIFIMDYFCKKLKPARFKSWFQLNLCLGACAFLITKLSYKYLLVQTQVAA